MSGRLALQGAQLPHGLAAARWCGANKGEISVLTADAGALVGIAVGVGTMALFSLMAWKMWHGQWLNLIAGNYYVTKEEMKQPLQRALGRKVAVCVLLFVGMVLGVIAMSVGEAAGIDELAAVGTFMFGAFTVAAIADTVYIMVWSRRLAAEERRVRLEQAQAKGPAAERREKADAAFEKRQERTILIVLGAILVLFVLIVPLLVRYAG